MRTIVIKFGGSSLADPGRIRRAAALVLAARRGGRRPVAVVSAPADSTEDLLKLAVLAGGTRVSARETDALLAAGEQFSAALMAMAIAAEGGKAVSLTGFQAGLRTDDSFSNASVLRADTRRLRKELAAGRVPVVAGFQGMSGAGDLTTLGRGGSDLTAVVLAGALGSELCEFRTDVKGIYTAHPAIVPEAAKIRELSYGEVISLAELGTEVRQLRAVKYAAARGIPLHLRSSFHDESGTLVSRPGERTGVSALSVMKDGGASLVSAVGLGLGTAHTARALAAAASAGIRTRLARRSSGSITLTAARADSEKLLKALHRAFFASRSRH